MSRKRCQSNMTNHSYIRICQRTGWSIKQAKDMVERASKLGLSPLQIDKGPLQDFCIVKGRFKRLKLYKGYIFIFNKNSNRLITMYKVPEELRN